MFFGTPGTYKKLVEFINSRIMNSNSFEHVTIAVSVAFLLGLVSLSFSRNYNYIRESHLKFKNSSNVERFFKNLKLTATIMEQMENAEKKTVSLIAPFRTTKFIYLITSCEFNNDFRLTNTATRNVLRLTYCEKVENYPAEKLTIIHGPNSTWTDARNSLLEYALFSILNIETYEYFIFMDNDMLDAMVNPVQNPIESLKHFERFLTEKSPSIGFIIGSTSWMKNFKPYGNTNTDPNIVAYHKTTVMGPNSSK